MHHKYIILVKTLHKTHENPLTALGYSNPPTSDRLHRVLLFVYFEIDPAPWTEKDRRATKEALEELGCGVLRQAHGSKQQLCAFHPGRCVERMVSCGCWRANYPFPKFLVLYCTYCLYTVCSPEHRLLAPVDSISRCHAILYA